jgi:SAM-dependent methyltransferase
MWKRTAEITERFWRTIIKDALFRLFYLPQEVTFHSSEYLRMNSRRLEHLASLRLALSGKSVLELGAGIGDHSHYYLDRGCQLTITEVRKRNLSYLRKRFPNVEVHHLDLEEPIMLDGAPFDVVHCYGILYHLTNPGKALDFIGRLCKELLLLETVISFSEEGDVLQVKEIRINPTQSYVGSGSRPTRTWVFRELKKHFAHVYIPRTQPNHEQFPIDWSSSQSHGRLSRAIFIGSREPIENDLLSDQLLMLQRRQD